MTGAAARAGAPALAGLGLVAALLELLLLLDDDEPPEPKMPANSPPLFFSSFLGWVGAATTVGAFAAVTAALGAIWGVGVKGVRGG